MALTYDLFWSFRSPYSYLSTPQLIELESTYDVVARVRPVYPIAVRIDGFFKTVNPLWWRYLRRSAHSENAGHAVRLAEAGPDRDEPANR